ncbi:MAG: APC family permease, partial [Geodermatophilales bacterium]|nr:APC family permease [Geodermatophilales bacterium]
FLAAIGIWPNPPSWAPFLLAALALLGCLALTIVPAKRGTSVLLSVEGATVALIVVISAIVLVRLLAGTAPGGQTFTWSVFSVPPGTDTSALFLGVVFGFLSFAGFEAAATLGEEARHPRKDIPRAILGTAIFGGIYFTIVTAIEVMGFGADDAGVHKFIGSGSLLGDLGREYIAGWVGDLITIGAAISAFGCCLACMVGASRLAFAFARDMRREGTPPTGLAGTTRAGTPGAAAILVLVVMAVIMLVMAMAGGGEAFNVFLWSGTIGTLILLVAYVLTTIGAIKLVFVERRMPSVPMWQVIIPIAALVVLGYTLYRNVVPFPSPDDGALFWNPIVAGIWIVVCIVAVLAAGGAARRAGAALTAAELGARQEEVGAR